jgi:hypothetical protein
MRTHAEAGPDPPALHTPAAVPAARVPFLVRMRTHRLANAGLDGFGRRNGAFLTLGRANPIENNSYLLSVTYLHHVRPLTRSSRSMGDFYNEFLKLALKTWGQVPVDRTIPLTWGCGLMYVSRKLRWVYHELVTEDFGL